MTLLAFSDPLNQLPPAASTFAGSVDALFYFTLWISAFFFFLITGVLVYTSIKHRRRTEDQPPASDVTHNTTLEVVWTIVPLIIVMVIFAWGLKDSLDMTVAKGEAKQVRVEAFQWGWRFYHPGALAPATDLYVPLGHPVKIVTSSQDVLHSLFIPAFRVKRDVLPGRNQMVWFQATQLSPPEGFPLMCTEYCGASHSQMLARVHVLPLEEWEKKPWQQRPDDPVEWGALLYAANCKSCHTLDGAELIGPTFKGIWGREGQTVAGESYVVDDAYFHESVREPQAKIVAGFQDKGAMTTFSEQVLPPDALDALKQFLQQQK